MPVGANLPVPGVGAAAGVGGQPGSDPRSTGRPRPTRPPGRPAPSGTRAGPCGPAGRSPGPTYPAQDPGEQPAAVVRPSTRPTVDPTGRRPERRRPVHPATAVTQTVRRNRRPRKRRRPALSGAVARPVARATGPTAAALSPPGRPAARPERAAARSEHRARPRRHRSLPAAPNGVAATAGVMSPADVLPATAVSRRTGRSHTANRRGRCHRCGRSRPSHPLPTTIAMPNEPVGSSDAEDADLAVQLVAPHHRDHARRPGPLRSGQRHACRAAVDRAGARPGRAARSVRRPRRLARVASRRRAAARRQDAVRTRCGRR